MSKHDIATPYAAVYAVFRKEGKIALLLRSNTQWMNGHYGLPAGKLDHGESIMSAAIREVSEEVGVQLMPHNLKLILTGHRHHDDSEWIDAVFEVNNCPSEPYNAEPDVHGELIWADPQKLPDNMVPYVREYILAIGNGQNYAEHGWQ